MKRPRSLDQDRPKGQTSSVAGRRFILLGASNVALAFPRIVSSLIESVPEGLEIFAAFGHGRSYGLETRVLGRQLFGIRQCGLWPALAGQSPIPPLALLTDIGNDLLYGVSVARIIEWVEESVRRLEAVGARTVITLPPVASVAHLSQWRYGFLRRLLFPGNRDSLDLTRQRLEDLREQLYQLVQCYGLRAVEPKATWFGLDPIHIRPRAQGRAWGEILRDWPLPPELPRPGWCSSWHLWRLAPAERRLWGRRRTCPQPHEVSRRTTVHLY